MRVLLQTYAFWPSWGGVQKFVLALYRHLRSSGVDAAIATSSSIVISEEETYSTRSWTDTKGATLKRFRFTSEPLNLYREKKARTSMLVLYLSFLRYCAFLFWYRPRIVHLIFINVDAWFALRAQRIFKFKVVTSCRGSDVLRFDQQNSARQALIRETLNSSDIITAVSEEVANKVRAIMEREFPVQVIPNGVDKIETPFQQDHSRTFIFVGHLDSNKNPEFLLHTFVAFYKKHPDYKLWLIGRGPLLEKLTHIASSENLEAVVQITGGVSFESTLEKIRQSVALILPSFLEGCPNVVLEAMSVGTPVIGSDRSGIREIISDNENGLLFQFNDTSSLISCMEKMIESSEFRARLARNALATVREKHDQRQLLDRYKELYERVASDTGAL